MSQDNQANLNEDAKKLTSILKKSVEPDIDILELQKECALFSTRISKYSDSDRLYLSKVGLLFNELVLATWDDYVENLEKFETTEYTPSAGNEKIQNIIMELGKYGLKLEMDEEIPGAREMLFEMKQSLSETKYKEMLKQVRTWIKSDLDSTYESIFAKDCKLDADT
ncbi:MAG: hypothetical protein O6940_00245, partial [Ignavibacteria bacterium]|nr:hypothetical protein [Ignavibacteria bacterium]